MYETATIRINGSAFEEKNLGIRIVVGITCGLSIIGSLLIILSYIVHKKNRTKTREILVHISLMDLGVGLSNLIGLLVYFDQFYSLSDDGLFEAHVYIDNLCKTQAFFAAFCSLGSIFWTTALAGYLYVVILYHENPRLSIYYLRFCYILCYGLAFFISIWLVLCGKLGYSPFDSSGWCSLIVKDPVSGKSNLFVVVFAYDLWMYLAIFLIIVFYISVRSFVSKQFRAISKESRSKVSAKKFWSSMNFVDYKFILIPIIFVLLRMWSCIVTIILEYADTSEKKLPEVLIKILIYLAGIGDSGQGFTNAILFFLFTKSVRNRFARVLICCKKKASTAGNDEDIVDDDDSTTSQLEHSITSIMCKQSHTNTGEKQDYMAPLLSGNHMAGVSMSVDT